MDTVVIKKPEGDEPEIPRDISDASEAEIRDFLRTLPMDESELALEMINLKRHMMGMSQVTEEGISVLEVPVGEDRVKVFSGQIRAFLPAEIVKLPEEDRDLVEGTLEALDKYFSSPKPKL